MKKVLIVYFSQGGTTEKIAKAIRKGLLSLGYLVDLCNIKNEKAPDIKDYNLLGIGFPVYYYRPPFNITDYARGLDLKGMPFFVFVLHGTYKSDAATTVRKILTKKEGVDLGYFHSFGADTYLGYLKRGYLFSPDHPQEKELIEAERFGREIAFRSERKSYLREKFEKPPQMIYRLERFLTKRWLVKHLYSRLFRVNMRNCGPCNICIESCPLGNIKKDKKGRPIWGHNCLLCLSCQMKCPREAIKSAVDTPVFGLFISYNIRKTREDPSINFERVILSHGNIIKLKSDKPEKVRV